MSVMIAKRATPAAIAVACRRTAIAHISQSPNSDHNTGYAVDLTHDKLAGIDCFNLSWVRSTAYPVL